jgi:hypothetical protein
MPTYCKKSAESKYRRDADDEPTGERYVNPKFTTGIFLPDWLLDIDGLSVGAKFCYARLARLAQKWGFARIRNEELGKTLRVSSRQAVRYLRELVDAGLIQVECTGKANRYRILRHSKMTEAMHFSQDKNVMSPTHSQDKDVILPRQICHPAKTDLSGGSYPENLKRELKDTRTRRDPTSITINNEFSRVIDWWFKQYENKFGSKYHFTGKDGVIVKRLLKEYGAEQVKATALRMLQSTDKWIASTARDLGILSSQWNKLQIDPEAQALKEFETTLPPSFANYRDKRNGDSSRREALDEQGFDWKTGEQTAAN